jgi:predicted Zn-dependent protease
MRHLRKSGSVFDDPQLNRYLNQIGAQLASQLPPSAPALKFFWVDAPSVNAFAAPDGWIGVHTGLLLATEHEGEFASVLAHEMAHISQQHFYRYLEEARKLSLPAAAALLAAVLLGSQSPELGRAAGAALQAGLVQRQINFTRDNEYEADFLGMQLLAKSSFDPTAMATFFEKLQDRVRFAGSELPEFLRTHPVTPSRITESRARAATLPHTAMPDSLGYTLARVRLQVRASRDPAALAASYTRELAANPTHKPSAQRYGTALALQATRDFAGAQAALAPLLKQAPDNLDYALLQTQLDQAQGNTTAAVQRLAELHFLYPQDWGVSESYLATLLQTRQIPTARRIAQSLHGLGDTQPAVFRWQARVADAAGQAVQSYAYQAEYSHALGDLPTATTQLESALRLPGLTLSEQAQLGARLREFKQESADLKADQ